MASLAAFLSRSSRGCASASLDATATETSAIGDGRTLRTRGTGARWISNALAATTARASGTGSPVAAHIAADRGTGSGAGALATVHTRAVRTITVRILFVIKPSPATGCTLPL